MNLKHLIVYNRRQVLFCMFKYVIVTTVVKKGRINNVWGKVRAVLGARALLDDNDPRITLVFCQKVITRLLILPTTGENKRN